jgi:hypothetical protein
VGSVILGYTMRHKTSYMSGEISPTYCKPAETVTCSI